MIAVDRPGIERLLTPEGRQRWDALQQVVSGFRPEPRITVWAPDSATSTRRRESTSSGATSVCCRSVNASGSLSRSSPAAWLPEGTTEYISLLTMSVCSPTERTKSSVCSNAGVRISR